MSYEKKLRDQESSQCLPGHYCQPYAVCSFNMGLFPVFHCARSLLPLSCYKKKLQNLSHLNRGLQIRQIWTQLIAAYVY